MWLAIQRPAGLFRCDLLGVSCRNTEALHDLPQPRNAKRRGLPVDNILTDCALQMEGWG